jgi:hypothetical protein
MLRRRDYLYEGEGEGLWGLPGHALLLVFLGRELGHSTLPVQSAMACQRRLLPRRRVVKGAFVEQNYHTELHR